MPSNYVSGLSIITIRRDSQAGGELLSPVKSKAKTSRNATIPTPMNDLIEEELPSRSFATPANDYMEEFERQLEKSKRKTANSGGRRIGGKSSKKGNRREGKLGDDADMDEYARWVEEEIE
ncbi:hypothetical protein VNI00_012932 [Paramarasmius palmivorus]|uniref:Chromatin target of PRMT1 protein C-terminal domain-containing protein n=1 Tax=Paramarasmius palmivorus TaxID=297713 RepID=A0AAW0BZN2_9AGAR